MMVRLTKTPIPDRETHRERVSELERVFRALLHARDVERLTQESA